MKLLLILLFFLSCSSFAKRYITPNDNNVLVTINDSSLNPELSSNQIDVLVWNIYKGVNVSWKNDYLSLIENMDIILLQEAFLDKKMTNVFKDSSWLEHIFATSWIDTKERHTASGVLNASKVKSVDNYWQRSYYREPFIRTPKMTLFTKYKLSGSGKELLVGNIHAINFVRAYKLRNMLDKAAKRIQLHKGPVLFAGDFNTWTRTKINNMNAVFKKLGMTSVKFKKDTRKSALGNILDHAWIKGLNVLSATVPKVLGSDHAPMVLSLSIQE